MTHRISIFDIPHITDLIAYYLDPPDIASCTLVSKDFNARFQPSLWRTILIDNKKIDALVPKLGFKSGLEMMMNFRWTRRMALSADCRKAMLPLLIWQCNNLREVATIVNDYQTFQVVLALVTTNQRQLRSWTLCYRDTLDVPALQQLSRVISHSFRLTTLEMSLQFSPPLGWFGHLLKNLPQSLSELHVVWAENIDDEPQSERRVAFPFRDWSSDTKFPQLKAVEFGMGLEPGEEDVLVQFLERCPVLQELDLPTMETLQFNPLLTVLGPTARTLTKLSNLYLGWMNVMTDNQWRDLILAMRGRIEEFSADTDFRTPSTFFVPNMVRYWSNTLRSLRFLYLAPIYNSDVQLILTTCVGLKAFECTSVANLDTTVTTQDNSDTNIAGLDMGDWVCLGLEELQMSFLNVLPHGTPQPVERVEYLYQQIGRLTNLKELSIGWSTTEGLTANAHLDMSLQSGLSLMQNLEALESLDISRIKKIKVGLDEATWILRHWPKLTHIRGLRYRADGPEQECFHKLSERQDLTVD
jgi:hypothetical protein